jgi:integrase
VICHVYRRGRLYWGKLQLEGDLKLTRFPLGTTDRRVAQAKLFAKLREREMEAAGLLAPASTREAAVRPLLELLDEFLMAWTQGRSPETVLKYGKTLRKLIARCCWRTFADVSVHSFCDWRMRCGLSPKTLNDLLGALQVFLGWLVQQRLAVENPLKHVQRINTRGTWRQYRRALSVDELRNLLNVSPEHRRMVYFIASFTGLRRKEMKGLRWGDMLLDAATPCVRIRGSTTKNGKDATLPLHPDLVASLHALRPPGVASFAPVLTCAIPRVSTFRRDLGKAGIAFLDGEGRRVDVHALRMTYGTNLTLGGAQPRVVMELMRHSDIKLTMKIYTDAGQLPLADAVAKLPGVQTNLVIAPPQSAASG